MEKVIDIKDLSFGYDEGLILENIDLDIYQGDYIGIVGPNGSGKSTLLKIMLNILQPTKGKIKILDKETKHFKNWGKIGYVAQKATSFNTGFPATVEEVVGLNLFPQIGLFKSIKKNHYRKIDEVLEVVGMTNFKKRLIGNLSGGQQQKVFIARAIINSPRILFLDEPTVGIDVDSQREFYDLLSKLNKKYNMTIVLISHDIGVITEKVNRIACMGDKKLFCHHNNSQVPIGEILKKVYGDKMKLLIHEH